MDAHTARAAFAAELARRRADAELSLGKLAGLAHASRGYLHHIERGRRWPTVGVARALDTALEARGALLAAWDVGERAAVPVSADPDEFERFERALADPRRTDAAVVGHLRRMLAEQRRAEDALGPRRLLPPVLAQVSVIDAMARDARGPIRRELLEVASHYDQFAAWMAQDTIGPRGCDQALRPGNGGGAGDR